MASSGTEEPSSEERDVLDRMEGLVRAMKGQRREPSVVARPGEDEADLAEAAWGALNVRLPSSTGGASGRAAGAWVPLERGAIVGRYVVLRTLGAGGMGVVHAAYDPELDRKVALKLVLPGMGGDEGRARLLREAQALAKLSHRNVVAIHDVGTMGEEVWIAMELVRGQTLRQWLQQPRHWREVLAVMRRAGRGLAAAHAAELLHRDFKPENVMVGKKGGVKVMDFGLARARSNAMASMDADASVEAPVPTNDALATGVTEAGMLVGTPLYMAPEQHLGRELTPAADQFSLCVTLWEALYGQRPFGGATLHEVLDEMLAGRLREPPKGRAVPGWLRMACERGLAVEPARRWPSVEALLEALAKGQARARARKVLGALGGLAVLAAGAEGYRRLDVVQRAAACEASGDEIGTAWNAERKQALHDALVATGVSHAPTTAEKVMPWLDAQAEAWRDARVEACLDAEVHGRWDAERLDRSLWCLDERRMELQSLVDELTRADAEVVQKAVPAAAGLASVAPCRDERALQALAPPPDEDRDAIRTVRADVAQAYDLALTGRYAKGLELARRALERAEALGWPPLVALARAQLGALLNQTGVHGEAETALEEAYFEANEGVAPEVAYEAATMLVSVVGDHLARPAEGRRWGRHAEAASREIVPDDQGPRRATLLHYLAIVHLDMGAFEDARVLEERALAIRQEVLAPEHPDVAGSFMSLANVYAATGENERARSLYERALPIFEEALGPEHPDVAMALMNLANVHETFGAYEDARALHERALSIFERALGPEHPDVAMSLGNLAIVHATTGANEAARALFERALRIRETVLGPEHPDVAGTLDNLAIVYDAMGAYEEARARTERALRILEKALGPEHPDVARSLDNLALRHAAVGDHAQARVLHERALRIREKALGPDHLDVADSLNNLANAHQAMGAYDEAIALHERALRIREEALGPDHLQVGRSVANLALVHRGKGAYDDAKTSFERAIVILESEVGPEHPDLVASLVNLGLVHYETGSHADAKALFERALARFEAALGPEHPSVADPLVGLAMVALAQRRFADAASAASRAVDIREKSGVAVASVTEARLILAQALWEAPVGEGRDRARALTLLEQAREALRGAGEGSAEPLARVEQWLAENAPARSR